MSSGPDPIEALLSTFVQAGRMPGASWWVESGGTVLSRGVVGVTSTEPPGEPVSEATPYDLASLTKALVTAPLLVLLEQHDRLSLDDPLGEHVEEFRGTPWAETSLMELATHSSGLPAWQPLYLRATNLNAVLERIAALEPAVRRGTTLYSDLGFIVLGALVERVTGELLPEAWSDIVGTLDLRRTGYPRDAGDFAAAAATECGNAYERKLAGEASTDYRWRETIPRGEVHDANAHALGGVAGHAGLFGVASEVAAVARQMVEPGHEPFGDRARALLLEPVAGAAGRTVGMVAAAVSDAASGVLPDAAPGHTGFTGTSLWLEPRSRGIFVLLTNRVHPVVGDSGFQDVRRRFHAEAFALARTTPPDVS